MQELYKWQFNGYYSFLFIWFCFLTSNSEVKDIEFQSSSNLVEAKTSPTLALVRKQFGGCYAISADEFTSEMVRFAVLTVIRTLNCFSSFSVDLSDRSFWLLILETLWWHFSYLYDNDLSRLELNHVILHIWKEKCLPGWEFLLRWLFHLESLRKYLQTT